MQLVCVDPLNPTGRPTPAILAQQGFAGVRSVFFDHPDWYSYHRQVKQIGLKSIITLASESFGGRDKAEVIGNLPTDADMVVIGNEPDGDPPSSWVMTPSQFRTLIRDCAPAVQARCPQAMVIAGGLSSGQPGWVEPIKDDVMALCDGWDIHPYAKGPAEARALLRQYKDALGGLPLLVLEWNRPVDQISDFVRMLEQETEAAAWFCWSNGMVDGFGLVDHNGNPKPELAALSAAIGAQAPSPPTPEPPVPTPDQPHYILGFEKWHNLEPGLLGDAVTNEKNVAPEWQTQPTSQGILSWVGGKGHAFVTRSGRVYRWEEDWPASQEVV